MSTSRPSQPVTTPLPIQFTQLKKSDLEADGLPLLNAMFTQAQTALNAQMGAAGKTVLPAGIDVQGATISGVGSPQSPSDAVSSGHVNANYSADALRKQLDLGGSSTLRGLTLLWQRSQNGISATITTAKLTSGGTEGSLTFTNGLLTGYVAAT